MLSVSTTYTWTVCIHFQTLIQNCNYSGKNVIKSGKILDNVKRAVHFNDKNGAVDRMLRTAEKEKVNKTFVKLLTKTKATQTTG